MDGFAVEDRTALEGLAAGQAGEAPAGFMPAQVGQADRRVVDMDGEAPGRVLGAHGGCAAGHDEVERTIEVGAHSPAVHLLPGIGSIVPPGRGLRLQREHQAGGQGELSGGRCLRTGQQHLAFAFDQAGVEVGAGERIAAHQPAQEGHVGLQADHFEAGQRGIHARDRAGAIRRPGDQLRDHRVVVRRDGVAFAHAAVDAHRGPGRAAGIARETHRLGRAQVAQGARGRQEALVGVLGIHAHLDRVALDAQCLLGGGQAFAGGDPQLPFDQVVAGDHFSHRMLDLQPGVHLHEEESAVGIGDELDGAGADVVHRLCGRHRGFAHRVAAQLRHAGRRRLFDDLLVAPLHRAVALEQGNAVAVGVAEHLDLDVARPLHVALDQDLVVAEGALGFALARGQCGIELAAGVHDAHALAPAARAGLDQHRIADGVGLPLQVGRILVLAVVAGHQRHAGFFHQRLGGGLAAHGRDGRRRRADEHQAGIGHAPGESFVLGQESVAGVDRLRAAGQGDADDFVAAQIGLAGRRRPQPIGFVAGGDMTGAGVGIGIDGDGAQSHPARGGGNPAGDFAPVGNQDLAEHGALTRLLHRRRHRVRPAAREPSAACAFRRRR